MATATIDTRRWTREEYERLVEQGFFHPEDRLELVEGIIYEMTPQSSFHSTGIRFAESALRPVFVAGFDIRAQMPLALGFDSEPEPDIAVVLGTARDYLHSHPTSAVLIVEIADSSLLHDRKRKSRLYARAEIPEYWIMNVMDWCLEVYREPKGGVYRSHTVLRAGDTISPVLRSDATILIADLLPLPAK
jgi:Uma2 family endonuclease